MSNEFREDMRLYEIMGCSAQGTNQLLGLTFTLKTRTGTLEYLELDSLGNRFGGICDEV